MVDPPTPAEADDRPVPFVLRVAADWVPVEDASGAHHEALFFRDRVPLTGTLSVTSDGRDVQFSDVGITL
jgi:hypothetical protein